MTLEFLMNSPGLHLRPLILVRTSESCAKNWCVFMVWTVCVEHLGPAGGFLFGVRWTIQTYKNIYRYIWLYICNYIGRMFNWIISIMYQTKWLTLFGDPQLLQGTFKVLWHQWLSVGPWLPRSFWKASFHWTGPQQNNNRSWSRWHRNFESGMSTSEYIIVKIPSVFMWILKEQYPIMV